jgi:5-methylcytosine-specific restriction endonuclease McrA
MVNEATHCALCNDPLDKSARFTEPLAPQIDHIIQRIDGGSDEESNLRVVHARCNNAWSKVVPKYRLGAARGAVWLQAAGF